MPRPTRQTLAAALAATVAGGALAAGSAVASSQQATSAVPTPLPPKIGGALIQGLVADQTGKPVDGVKVQAFDEDGEVISSYWTYASDRDEGPQHGYYYLWVKAGSYEVVFEKDGYVPTSIGVDRAPREKEAVEEVELLKVMPTTTTASAPAKVRVGDKVALQVAVRTQDAAKPVGKVTVSLKNRKVDAEQLRAADGGKLTFRLPALPRGEHQLVVRFESAVDHLRDSSDKVTVEVVKRKRR